MERQTSPLIIYNLFPRFFTSSNEWIERVPAIAAMGFNAVFVNPFFETGFSGSLYAVKNFYRLNPLLIAKGADPTDFTPIVRFNEICVAHGLKLYIDLVINHTAVDADLTAKHAAWYQHDKNGALHHPFAIDPGDGSKVTVWGDLASIDNENSSDREGLWHYWDELIAFFQKNGINGFRCDAAYQVPESLWQMLILNARSRNPHASFLAETLGCRLEQIEALADAGFEYLFNSVKWWEFDQPWAIEQHTSNRVIAPSIAFPESHDTTRLAAEGSGTVMVQKSKYAFSAIFSQGLLMPIGYETGATTRIDVVKGTPDDLDPPQWDISEWIGRINALKATIEVLAEEGVWRVLTSYDGPYLFLMKQSANGNAPVGVCVNKSETKETVVEEWMVPDEVKAMSCAISLLNDDPVKEDVPLAFTLDPADVVLFY